MVGVYVSLQVLYCRQGNCFIKELEPDWFDCSKIEIRHKYNTIQIIHFEQTILCIQAGVSIHYYMMVVYCVNFKFYSNQKY